MRRASERRSGVRRVVSTLLAGALVTASLVAAQATVAQVAGASAATYPVPAVQPADGFPRTNDANTFIGTTVATPQAYFAYTSSTEDVAFLFRKLGNNNRAIEVRVTSPSGIVSTHRTPAAGQTNMLHGFGAGSLPREEGIWKAELVPLGGALTQDVTRLLSYSAVYSAAGAEKPGRVWTNRQYLVQPTATPPDLTVYYMSSLGYIYETTYRQYFGLNSVLEADGVGIVQRGPGDEPVCEVSMYRSATGADTRITPPDPDAIPAQGRCGSIYRIFFSPPYASDAAGAVPEQTARAGESPNNWVRPLIKPPSFDLVDYVGTSETTAFGILYADVQNFFGSATIDVYDDSGAVVCTFTANVPEPAAGEEDAVRRVPLPFNNDTGCDADIPRDAVSRFEMSGLNAGEIHFVGTDIEAIRGGTEVRALNGPTAGTSEATRVYWGDVDNFDGRPPSVPASVSTSTTGVLSAGGVRPWWGTGLYLNEGSWGDGMFAEMWTRQGVALTSELTLHDPDAEWTMAKTSDPGDGTTLLPGSTVTYTLTLQ
ncbi:MAG: hypothetical protein WBX17_05265, partial [Microbacterium sp.]